MIYYSNYLAGYALRLQVKKLTTRVMIDCFLRSQVKKLKIKLKDKFYIKKINLKFLEY